MEDAFELLGYLALVLVGFLILIWTAVSVGFHFEKIGCERTSEATGLSTKYVGDKWVGGCFVETDGKWIDADNYGMGFTQK